MSDQPKYGVDRYIQDVRKGSPDDSCQSHLKSQTRMSSNAVSLQKDDQSLLTDRRAELALYATRVLAASSLPARTPVKVDADT